MSAPCLASPVAHCIPLRIGKATEIVAYGVPSPAANMTEGKVSFKKN
jgi:hypothetical protein